MNLAAVVTTKKVAFASITGRELEGVVADLIGSQARVMNALVPLEGDGWQWSEWVPLDKLRESTEAGS